MSINVLEFLSSLSEQEQESMCQYYKDMIDSCSRVRAGYKLDNAIFIYFNTTDTLFIADFIDHNLRNFRTRHSHKELSCTKCTNGFLFKIDMSDMVRAVQSLYMDDINNMIISSLAEERAILYFEALYLMG